jgi:predicted RNA-binding protein YlxR (DUF448 family)
VPRRTCIACRTAAPKRSFVRVVRTPTGAVQIDPTGKVSGRGASICGTRACWTKALSGGVLERALRVEVSADDRAALVAYLETLPVDGEAATGDADDSAAVAGGAAGSPA